jgi:hypothetical protein
MAKQTFTAGQVLEAADLTALQANDYNWTVDTKTDSYVLVAGDAGKRIVMNAATAKTITVNTSIFTAGDTVWIHNINTGTCTVTAGTATVNTAGSLALAQWEGGALYFTSASTAIFFRGGPAPVNPVAVEYLIVAGGGGGGNTDGSTFAGGGAGAGGYRCAVDGEKSGGNTNPEGAMLVTSGVTYTVTVGGGGASNSPGTDSSIVGTGVSITATGGGRGKGTNSSAAGGSGGGGNLLSTPGGAGTTAQGSNGGSSNSTTQEGGGGGALEAGNTDGQGEGGDGLASSISGSSVTRGGGGGGASIAGNPPGSGGLGGGGAGSLLGTATPGTINTGGGGGGVRNNVATGGASGGSGVVIIRQLKTAKKPTTLTVGTETTVGNYLIYTFNASGTIGWS